ncbi:MAG: hypothetical protein R3C49_24465 [Planctomycetaceae bacterium]
MLNWLKTLLGGSSHPIPAYYPELSDRELAEFMTEDDFQRIQKFRCVYIFPFAGPNDDREQVLMGVGLSHQIIRNLMLLSDVSIHGPEDTPLVAVDFENASEIAAGFTDEMCVFGRFRRTSRWELDVLVMDGETTVGQDQVVAGEFQELLIAACQAIARRLGSSGQLTHQNGWNVGQPPNAAALAKYGDLVVSFDRMDGKHRTPHAIELMKTEPQFALPAWQCDDDLKISLHWHLEGLLRDPLNAQTCFLAFCSMGTNGIADRRAMQFCRKAIGISPGHGKAHMCAPHTAHPQAYMLRHSKLGYQLLKGNSFAVNNYIHNLVRYGAPPDQLLEIAEEGIAIGPHNPGSYHQMIDIFWQLKQYKPALNVAYQLRNLFEPEINPRAIYCLRQTPELARRMDAGTYDPVQETRDLIRQLEQMVGSTSDGE